MENELNKVKAGDSVFVIKTYNWQHAHFYKKAVVDRVTKTLIIVDGDRHKKNSNTIVPINVESIAMYEELKEKLTHYNLYYTLQSFNKWKEFSVDQLKRIDSIMKECN